MEDREDMRRAGKLQRVLSLGILLALLAEGVTGCAPVGMPALGRKAAALLEDKQGSDNSSMAMSLPAEFDVQSKWDRMERDFDFAVTTDEPPMEGVVFRSDLLVQTSAKPQFLGRMNVSAILLVGEEQRWVQGAVPAQVRAINFTESVIRDGAVWYRTKVEVTFSGTVDTDVDDVWTGGIPYHQAVDQAVTGLKVSVAGSQCNYTGMIRLENPVLGYTAGGGDGISVNSTVSPNNMTAVSMQGDMLTFENGMQQPLPQMKLSDPGATEATVRTARYLAAMGNSDHTIIGHQESVWSKSGTAASPINGLTSSDVEDVTGSPAGMIGFDGLSLAGQGFNAVLWNSSFAKQEQQRIDIDALGEPAANVKALASLSNYCLDRGSLITLSCHMPNFSQVKERSGYQEEKEPKYARYDFTSSTVRDKSGNVMQGILPGGAYNAAFTAYLDMIADYASQVDGAILFRPFHEGNGSWFWWGTDMCDAGTYQEVFRYVVAYLRDQKKVHNLLYVYSADGKQSLMKEAENRYPGDAYVDLIGFDIYQTDPEPDSGAWFTDFTSRLSRMERFAARHGKPFAVAEIGTNTSVPAPGDLVTCLQRSGCPDQQWFEKLLDRISASRACYMLIWSNTSEVFQTPFVRAVNSDGSLYGHELMDDFLRFYNDRRSVFAEDQAEIIRGF